MTSCFWFLVTSFLASFVNAKIGFFWHISDIHYDLKYPKRGDTKKDCWRSEYGHSHYPAGNFGHYDCDSPWALVSSVVKAMKEKHGEDIEFVIWTGGSLSKHLVSQSKDTQEAALQNLTELLKVTFSSQFVFPVLGHNDPDVNLGGEQNFSRIANLWKHWLPNEALTTFNKGGYYTIEQKKQKLRIIALNTNLYTHESYQKNPVEDPADQWKWLRSVLEKSKINKEFVYIMGHMGPGVDERHPQDSPGFLERFAEKYLGLVRKYSDIIVGQFYGHLHSDTFRIVYNETGHPVSWMMMSPSVSPRGISGGNNNPGVRLYKFDMDTGQVLDYTQYYLDLAHSNGGEHAEWVPEYNLTSYYQLREVSTISLHNLAERLKDPSSNEFARYYAANSVQYNKGGCDNRCAHTHYCAITCLIYHEFSQCLELGASSALASTATICFRSGFLTQLLFILIYKLVDT